jgi:hypothetical protein
MTSSVKNGSRKRRVVWTYNNEVVGEHTLGCLEILYALNAHNGGTGPCRKYTTAVSLALAP